MSSSSSPTLEESRASSLRVQRPTEETLQRKMLCWLVSQGSEAMKDALKYDTELPPRTDLGEQAVRIAEVRGMTSAAYASGKPTRLKFWYGRFRRMFSKKEIREKVNEHLTECSDHKEYKTLRDKIEFIRGESSESETSSPVRKSVKVKVERTENVGSGSVSGDELATHLRGIIRAKNSRSVEKKVGRILHMKNSESGSQTSVPKRKLGRILSLKLTESVSDPRTPPKKLEATADTKNTESELDESPVRKRGRINITESELSEPDENLPSMYNRQRI